MAFGRRRDVGFHRIRQHLRPVVPRQNEAQRSACKSAGYPYNFTVDGKGHTRWHIHIHTARRRIKRGTNRHIFSGSCCPPGATRRRKWRGSSSGLHPSIPLRKRVEIHTHQKKKSHIGSHRNTPKARFFAAKPKLAVKLIE